MIAVANKCYLEWKIEFAINIKSIESRSQFFESSLCKALTAMEFFGGRFFFGGFCLEGGCEIIDRQVRNFKFAEDLTAMVCYKGLKYKKAFKGVTNGRWTHGWLFHRTRMGIPGRGSVSNSFVPRFFYLTHLLWGIAFPWQL